MEEKKRNKYNRGKIYKIISDSTDKIYIGSSYDDLRKRLYNHKSKYKMYINGKYHYVTSFELIKNNDCDIILLEDYSCENKQQLHARERKLIEDSKNNCVNKNIPSRTHKEYYKEYRNNNKQKLNELKNEKFDCICGGKYISCHRIRHFNTKLHLDYLAKQNI
jgi:hypothetical protein